MRALLLPVGADRYALDLTRIYEVVRAPALTALPGAPPGVLGVMNLRVAAYGKLRRLWTAYLALGGTSLVVLVGVAAMIEMLYHMQLNAALGPELHFLGATLNVGKLDSWFGAVFLLITGAAMFELSRREFKRQWGETQEEIEKEIKRRLDGWAAIKKQRRTSE